MKKTILFFLMLFSATTYGQKFIVTPDGLRDSENPDQTFIILKADSMTARQLYDNAIKYVNKNFKNPQNVIKGQIEGEYFSFDTYNENFIMIMNVITKVYFVAKYRTALTFKDGKVKYEIEDLEMYVPSKMVSGSFIPKIPLNFTGGGLTWYIYNKKGELKKEAAKADIESYFNLHSVSLLESLKGKTVNDNW